MYWKSTAQARGESGSATLLRQSENVLGIAQAVRSRSNRALGFVNQHRVHLLTKGLCRAANSCKLGLIVGASRVACYGSCAAARLHIVEENRACVLGCPEGLVCGIVRCGTLFDHLRSLWPGNGECITPTTIFNDLLLKIAVCK